MLKSRFLKLVTLLLVILATSPVLAVTVKPMAFEFNSRPGATEELELIISAGAEQEEVQLTVYQAVQQKTGSFEFRIPTDGEFAMGSWLNLERTRLTVSSEGVARVRGTIRVPYDAVGTNNLFIMVEPIVNKRGISVVVQYAVNVVVNVDRPGLRPSVDVTNMGLAAISDKGTQVHALVKNTSQLRFYTKAEMTIRDSNKRLIERVELRPQVARSNNSTEVRIYPGAEIDYTGLLKAPLMPGEYEARLFFYYAEKYQAVKSVIFEVTADDYPTGWQPNKLKVDTEQLEVALRPGGVKTQVISYTNNHTEPVNVQIAGRDIERAYERSAFQALEVAIRDGVDTFLEPGKTGRMVMTFRAPRDVLAGGYYAYLDVNAVSEQGVLENHPVFVDVSIEGETSYGADVLSLFHDPRGGEHLFSLVIGNTSDRYIAPSGKLVLTDGTGSIISNMTLRLQEGQEFILPLQQGVMLASAMGLQPGEYTAEIQLWNGNTELIKTEMPLVVSDHRDTETD